MGRTILALFPVGHTMAHGLIDGFKPQVAADLLGIGKQTLRYWRTHIDPNGQSSSFFGGRLLAYRVLKVLIYQRLLPVETLQRCGMASLFEHCEHVAMTVLGQSFLFIDPAAGQLSLHERRPELSDDDLDAQVIPLKSIVSAHREALELAGHDPTQPQPQRQTLHAPGLTVIRASANPR